MALIDTEGIIENSIMTLIQKVLITEGYLPDVYDTILYPFEDVDVLIAEQAQIDYEAALKVIETNMGFSIEVFNYDDAQQRGVQTTPRIVIETQGFFPGNIGKDSTAQYKLDSQSDTFNKEFDGQKTSDLFINFHLVASSSKQIRILHAIQSKAIPRRGYIPRFSSVDEELVLEKSGNLYIEYISYNENSDTQRGVIEKVYRYMIPDVVEYELRKDNTPISKIITIVEEIKI